MKKKGSFQVGAVFLLIAFILLLGVFATIEPFKESLDEVRGTESFNCPGTTNHNATAYNEDTNSAKLVRRPVCFVTGVSMVWFIWVFIIATGGWVVRNWQKSRRR